MMLDTKAMPYRIDFGSPSNGCGVSVYCEGYQCRCRVIDHDFIQVRAGARCVKMENCTAVNVEEIQDTPRTRLVSTRRAT